jgi:hypothetical protein
MKAAQAVHFAALALALISFIVHIVLEGWSRPPAPGAAVTSASRPNLLALGLAFWVFAQLVGPG